MMKFEDASCPYRMSLRARLFSVGRAPSRTQLAALSESVRQLLAVIRKDEVTASPATVHRLEGALVGLEAALGRSEEALQTLHDPDSVTATEPLL